MSLLLVVYLISLLLMALSLLLVVSYVVWRNAAAARDLISHAFASLSLSIPRWALDNLLAATLLSSCCSDIVEQ